MLVLYLIAYTGRTTPNWKQWSKYCLFKKSPTEKAQRQDDTISPEAFTERGGGGVNK